MTTVKKAERLEARVTLENKALIERAAALEGRSLTDFIIASLTEEAHRVIQKHQILKLSMEDSQSFVDALYNPPAPNDSLQAAASRYKTLMSSNISES